MMVFFRAIRFAFVLLLAAWVTSSWADLKLMPLENNELEVRTYDFAPPNASADPEAIHQFVEQFVKIAETALYAKGGKAAAEAEGRRMFFDESTLQLTVIDTAAGQNAIRNLVYSGGVVRDSARKSRIVFCDEADSKEIADGVFGAQIEGLRSCEAIPNLNAIFLTGDADAIKMAVELIKRFDRPGPPPAPAPATSKVVRLEHANVRNLIGLMMTKVGPEVVLSTEPSRNALLIAGPADQVEEAAAMAQLADVPTTNYKLESVILAADGLDEDQRAMIPYWFAEAPKGDKKAMAAYLDARGVRVLATPTVVCIVGERSSVEIVRMRPAPEGKTLDRNGFSFSARVIFPDETMEQAEISPFSVILDDGQTSQLVSNSDATVTVGEWARFDLPRVEHSRLTPDLACVLVRIELLLPSMD